MNNDNQQTQNPTQEKKVYTRPMLLSFGRIEEKTRGSGDDESDGCSSGKYNDYAVI